MAASQACFSNEHIRILIAGYADCADLLSLETVNKSWRTTTQHMFNVLVDARPFKLFSFRTSSKYRSSKQKCARMFNVRKRRQDNLLLVGGSFRSNNSETFVIRDTEGALTGHLDSSLNLPVTLGSAASTEDVHGSPVLLGGWDDRAQRVLDTTYALHSRAEGHVWQLTATLPRPLCFPSADTTLSGDIVLVAGGDSPYRGGIAYRECLLQRAAIAEWQQDVVPPLQTARCGHSVVTTFNGTLVAAGGYGGGTDYLSSAELLTAELDRWTSLPSMSVGRSGMAMVLGPDGAIYAAGGSPDGTIGHRSLERLDLREGKWTKLADMHLGRGYTAGMVTAWDSFYVCGGMHNLRFQPGIENYDFRKGEWTTVALEPVVNIPALQIRYQELRANIVLLQAQLNECAELVHQWTWSQDPDHVLERVKVDNRTELLSRLCREKEEVANAIRAGARQNLEVLTESKFMRGCHLLMRY